MNMTSRQIRAVQSTWLSVLPKREAAAQLFYGRLFEQDPSLRSMFRGDMHEQGRKLMQVMDSAVNGLSDLDQIIAAVQALGRRHVGYGVQPHHYDSVGDALIWTLGQCLGAQFTAAAKDAWTTAYGVLAATMKDAAAARTPQR